MDQKMYKISCDPKCNFSVQSHDEQEALNLAMQHASKKHPEMNVTMDQLKGMMQTM